MILSSGLRDMQVVKGSVVFSVLLCAAIVAMGGALSQFELIPHPEDGFVYEWQLAEQTQWGQLTAWLGFAVHQLLIWATIVYAQRRYTKRDYTNKLRPVNLWAVGINFVFIILHYLQTLFFYDAIAQDIPSWTALSAVALMLIVILGMENQRRGLFFGRKVPMRRAFTDALRKYHGYFFSFAVIYTFWFHPMEPTWGHLVGFAHVVLVMAQGSLMFMRAHLNKRWMFLLEIMVLPHAVQVAINQGAGLMPMFLFGFAAIFLVTQMHGLGLKPWLRRAFYGSFVLAVLYVYIFVREPWQANEILRIPFIDYGVLFVMYAVYWVGARIAARLQPA